VSRRGYKFNQPNGRGLTRKKKKGVDPAVRSLRASLRFLSWARLFARATSWTTASAAWSATAHFDASPR